MILKKILITFLTVGFYFFSNFSNAENVRIKNDLASALLFTTVPINISGKDGKPVINGTGFIVVVKKDNYYKTLLVTNYHVIEKFNQISTEMFIVDKKNNEIDLNRKHPFYFSSSRFDGFISKELDIAFIPIDEKLENFSKQNEGLAIYYEPIHYPSTLIYPLNKMKELSAIEEVTFVGYPRGLQTKSSNFPIVRRGITATPVWDNFYGDPRNQVFLIDAGVFPGSSGSPVFIFNQGMYATKEGTAVGNRVVFLGMLKSSYISFAAKETPNELMGLGEVINVNTLLNFINKKLSEKIK